MRPTRKAYDRADWSLSDAQLAKKLGVSRIAVLKARQRRGIETQTGHGGKRKGAGRKKTKAN